MNWLAPSALTLLCFVWLNSINLLFCFVRFLLAEPLPRAAAITHQKKGKKNNCFHHSQPSAGTAAFLFFTKEKQLLDCSLGRLAPQIQIKSIHLFSFSKRKEDWLIDLNFAAISLLHQQPPVINQPSTCLISTYVCFLSIDILTVIIYFYSLSFNSRSFIEFNQIKIKFIFVFVWEEGNGMEVNCCCWLFAQLRWLRAVGYGLLAQLPTQLPFTIASSL